ncbi:MAG TPA: hypothetical protein VFW95_09565 [Candidatus Limnocylindria bacterium]|nr:hypothetical protein [Candidatus Limnocylindria bacterium]
MSGPWDRPSPQNPDDREPSWPAEDVESPSQQSPQEPWSAEDPWQERRDSSAWDAWPSSDDVAYQPELPTSDPWAETWTDDDVPAAPPEPAYEPTPTYEAPPAEPPAYAPPAAEPPVNEPPAAESPAYEPSPYEPPETEPPAYEPVAEAQPVAESPRAAAEPTPREPEPDLNGVPTAPFGSPAEPLAPTAETAAPRIEPWSPEADPWGIASDTWPPLAPVEAAAPSQPMAPELEEPQPGEPEPDLEALVEEPIEAAAVDVGSPTLPAAEPAVTEPAVTEPAVTEPAVTEPAVSEPAVSEPAVTEPPPAEPPASEPQPPAAPVVEPAAALDAEPAAAEVEPEADAPPAPVEAEPAAAEPEPEPKPDWAAAPGPIFGTMAAAEAVEPPPVDEAVPAAEPIPSIGAAFAEPEPEPEPAVAPEPVQAGEARPPDAEDQTGEADLAALAAAAAASTPAEESHEPPWAAALWGEEPPPPTTATAPPAAEPIDEVWPPEPDLGVVPPVGDHTQVFPSDWVPPPVASREGSGELEPESATVRTSLTDADVGAEAPSTAEQAVPWLIGLILLLAGMVIVLLALIFAGDASLGGAAAGPSGSGDPSPSLMVGALASQSTDPSASAAPSAAATPTPVPVPQYGPLEMVYQGRSAALAPIYLLRRDFTIDEDPAVLAQDADLDVLRHAWSPDGKVGAGLLADVLVSIEPGKEKRRLGDGIATLTFGDDASTVYAVRMTKDGGNDIASVLAIDFAKGDTDELASVTYERPALEEEAPLREAQFLDDGGTVRIFWMDDDTLQLWSAGAGAWSIDPESGKATELHGDLPLLWSADGHHHIAVSDKDGTSTLRLSNGSGAELATTTIKGLVSHLRWSPDGERVAFTVGHSASGGGVLQDLYLWDLKDGQAPMQLTSTGAGFGTEWLGTSPHWSAGE